MMLKKNSNLKKRTQLYFVISLLVGLTASASANAQNVKNEDAVLAVTVENDALVNSDRYYTNGIRIEYAKEKTTGKLADFLHTVLKTPEDTPVLQSFAIGQSIFTPEDIQLADPIEGQRPYAGFLFADMAANIAAENGTHWFLVQVGLVGPAARGEEIQNWWHDSIIDRPEAMGWDNQIPNEVGFVLAYDRQFSPLKIFGTDDEGMDFTPHAGIALGTFHTDVRAGATFRLGSGLSRDIGPPRIKPSIGGSGYFHESNGLDMHLFGGVETRLVAHDIFLDGSHFRDTAITVDSNSFVADLQFGTIIQYRDVQLSLAYVYRTKEYEGQSSPQQFTAFALAKRF